MNSFAAGASAANDGTQSKKIDEQVEEQFDEQVEAQIDEQVEGLRSITKKSRALGSLYLFERSGDKLLLESSPHNRDLQLRLGDILLDEYGSMQSKE